MRSRSYTTASVLGVGMLVSSLALTAARWSRSNAREEIVDFSRVVRTTAPAYDARLAPASDAGIKTFRIPIKDATIEIAKGVTYQGWTFGGTVPGPVIRARVGDRVRITVLNESPM